MACCFKRADVVDLLLTNGANVNMCDTTGSSPLHAAVQWCNPFDIRYSSLCRDACVEYARTQTVVQKLLERGAIVNLKNQAGNIPLHLAIDNNKRRLIDTQCTDIDVLLHNKSDIYIPSGFDGLNTLQLAAKKGKNSAVKFCLQYGMNPNQSRTHEQSPLYLAVKENHPQVVRSLLEHGAQIRFFRGDFSVLHTAAFGGLHEMVTLLLENGADPRVGNPLHWIQELASRVPLLVAGHVKSVKTLVANGATLKINNSPSVRACTEHGLPTLHFLLRSKQGHCQCQCKRGSLFYNPHLQHSFCGDIFHHLVRENAFVLTDDAEISFQLELRQMRQFFDNTCPTKLGTLHLIGIRFMLFSTLLRCGNFLIDNNKINDQWKALCYKLRQPLTLKAQSRIAIRRVIPSPLSASVGRLPYPRCMQEYLLMSDLCNL